MIEIAKSYSDAGAIDFIEMNNSNTEFQNDYFDIIIAKAVSNISTNEVCRILKTGGWFIYKEYGPGKGIVEIMATIRKQKFHSGDRIVEEMKQVGFGNIELRKFHIPLSRTRDEVRAIADTMRILPHGVTRGKVTMAIDEYYGGKSWKTIHSDPYLIIGQK
jgi:SAM-dependent methyltransferase